MNAEKLKMQVKTKAKENNLQPQDIMQMYFFERLLYRISISNYKHNFILKGGLLLSVIFGDERRTTGDMDTMIKGIELNFEEIKKVIKEIVNIELDDNIGNTRSKDFYDLYMLITNHFDELNGDIIIKAIKRTFKRREYPYDVNEIIKTFEIIKNSEVLKNNYINRYLPKNIYAKDISYEEIMSAINKIVDLIAVPN